MSSPKFIRLSVGGANTLINVTDVTTVVAVGAAAAQASTLTITYASGGSTLLTTAANADDNFLVAGAPAVVQAFWNIITEAVAQPWNQPVVPTNGQTAVLMSPATPQAVTAAFSAKQSTPVLNQGGDPLVFLTAV